MGDAPAQWTSLRRREHQPTHADESPDQPRDARAARLARAVDSNFKEQAEQLYVSMCEFVSRAVLQSLVSRSARVEALRGAGFDYSEEDQDSRLTFNQLSSIFVLTAAILLFGMLVASTTSHTVGELLFRVVMVSLIYCAAISCALYPKDRWSIARRDPAGPRPTGFYLLAGLMAAGLGLLISASFKVVLFASTLRLCGRTC